MFKLLGGRIWLQIQVFDSRNGGAKQVCQAGPPWHIQGRPCLYSFRVPPAAGTRTPSHRLTQQAFSTSLHKTSATRIIQVSFSGSTVSSGTRVPPLFLLHRYGSVVPTQLKPDEVRSGEGVSTHLSLLQGGKSFPQGSLKRFLAVRQPTLKLVTVTDRDLATIGLVL